jgi:hypothetical protein
MGEAPDTAPVSTDRHGLTAPVMLNLVTVRTLVRGLELLGISWSPVSYIEIRTTEPGLYAWVAGMLPDGVGLYDRPVVYVGISDRKAGGLQQRLTDETKLIGESAGHVHGRAMHRLAGTSLGAPVHRIPGAENIGRLTEIVGKQDIKFAIEFVDRGAAKLGDWLAAPRPSLLRKAEQLCIRIAVHAGDTAPPVNSHYATAWGTDAASDWGGWAVAQWLASGRT